MKKSIYVIIKGRSGNQLFQYAFARSIQEKTGGELILDFSELGFNKSEGKYGPIVHMDNVLDYFNVPPYTYVDAGRPYHRNLVQKFQYLVYRIFRKIYVRFPGKVEKIAGATSGILQRMGIYYQFSTNSLLGCSQPSKARKNFFIRGWFESAGYFDSIQDTIRKDLTLALPLPESLEELRDRLFREESICVSVRRGDFTSDAFKGEFLVCTLDYYRKGVSIILKEHPEALVFVCSDDVEWCKENLLFPSENIIFEPEGLSISEKLHLMTACHHFVLSNSTFSFWVQYLSVHQGRMVVSPSVWRRCTPPVKDIFMKDWILVDC